MGYQFDWSVIWEEQFLKMFLQGLIVTVLLTVVTTLLATAFGMLFAFLRRSRFRIMRGFAALYIEVFRGIPALLQVLFWGFAFPLLFPRAERIAYLYRNEYLASLSEWTGLPINFEFLAAVMGLSLNTSAYLAEILRAGLRTVPPGEVDAARSSGFGPFQIYRYLMLPQALSRMFPPLSTRLLHNMKNTALASAVSVGELFQQARVAISYTFRGPEFLVEVTIIYLLLSWSVVLCIRLIERVLRHRGLLISD